MLKGTLRCRQGEHEVTLGPGDYLLWDGTIPHEAENIGDGPARLLIVTSGPTGISVPDRRAEAECRAGDGNGAAPFPGGGAPRPDLP